MKLLLSLLFLLAAEVSSRRECIKRSINPQTDDPRIVCVCNSSYCDDVTPQENIDPGTVVHYQSNKAGLRLEHSILHFRDAQGNENGPRIAVDLSKATRQKIVGFGGAFTDAATLVADSLSKPARDNLWTTLFGVNGSQYNLARVPIASCDFSTGNYSYDDVDGDLELKYFKLASFDIDHKIPAIQFAQQLTGNGVKLLASPWSAPWWMKTNKQMQGGGSLVPDTAVWTAYANYIVKFFESYNASGINFFAVTPQNEATISTDPNFKYQAMYFSNSDMGRFIGVYLGPALRVNALTRNMEILIVDFNRYNLQDADEILTYSGVDEQVTGIASHWYSDNDDNGYLLTDVHNKHPTKYILYTEACIGWDQPAGQRVILGSWPRGERYAWDILTDLNNWVTGWIDWNMALDTNGGPNWVDNTVDATILVNATSNEFYKQPTHYALAHFSKFLRPGAVFLETDSTVDADNFQYATFVDPNQHDARILVFKNSGESAKTFSIVDAENPQKVLDLSLDPHSIHTVIYRPPATGKKCFDGWTKSTVNESLCYLVHNERLEYRNAVDFCGTQSNGHVVVIHNGFEASEVQGLISGTVWVGLEGKNGVFSWTDGETSPYRKWAPGQPKPGGDCTRMEPDGLWYATSCSATQYVICQAYV